MPLTEKKNIKTIFYALALALVCSFKLVLAADSDEFKLFGNLKLTSTFVDEEGPVSNRSILSPDGSRLLDVSLKLVTKGGASKQFFAVFTVWNTNTSPMTQLNTTEKLQEDPYNQLQLMGSRFSANNKVIVFSQNAPHDNFFWEYEASDKTEVACPAAMGSTITAVSESGKYFAVTTDDDYQYVCETYSRINNDYFDLFFYGHKPFDDQQVIDLKNLGDDVKARGFIGDKILITYPENKLSVSSRRQFQEFARKYPQVELVALKDIDRVNPPKAIKEPMNNVHVDLFSAETPSIEIVSTDLFGDTSYQMKEYVFEKFGCKATDSSRYYKKVDQDIEIRSIKGGFIKMSDDGSTLLSCDGEKLYVYKK